jgi:hypothetical protein
MIRPIWLSAAVTLWLYAQQTTTTKLQVQIQPEAHLAPQQISLSFRVSPDGSSEVTRQTESIAAWVRALPGQRIRLQARVLSMTGPIGPISPTALGWSGGLIRASSGAQNATCTAGTFDGAQPADLISNWTRFASLACAVTFLLISPRTLPPGSYTGTVDLVLRAE